MFRPKSSRNVCSHSSAITRHSAAQHAQEIVIVVTPALSEQCNEVGNLVEHRFARPLGDTLHERGGEIAENAAEKLAAKELTAGVENGEFGKHGVGPPRKDNGKSKPERAIFVKGKMGNEEFRSQNGEVAGCAMRTDEWRVKRGPQTAGQSSPRASTPCVGVGVTQPSARWRRRCGVRCRDGAGTGNLVL